MTITDVFWALAVLWAIFGPLFTYTLGRHHGAEVVLRMVREETGRWPR